MTKKTVEHGGTVKPEKRMSLRIQNLKQEIDSMDLCERDRQLSELFQLVTKKKENFIKEALKISTFSEPFINDNGEEVTRRPVVILDTPFLRRAWLRRISILEKLFEQLHELAPERFPQKCHLLRHRAIVVHGALSAKIYTASAINSRIMSVDNLLLTLNKTKQKIMRLPDNQMLISKDAQTQLIDESIRYFKKNRSRKLRVRAVGYTDVIANVDFKGDFVNSQKEREKFRISELGIFFIPHRSVMHNFSAQKTDIKPVEDRQPLFYNKLKPIKIPLITNNLYYWEDLVEKERGKTDSKFIEDYLPRKMPKSI